MNQLTALEEVWLRAYCAAVQASNPHNEKNDVVRLAKFIADRAVEDFKSLPKKG